MAAGTVAVPAVGSTSSAWASSAIGGALGVYPNNSGPQGAASFSSFEGAPVRWVQAYLTGQGWSSLDNPSWAIRQWQNTGYQVVWSVPIINAGGDTLEAGAAGNYNQHFLNMGSALVAGGQAWSTLRLGWEFGGSYMPWSAASDPAAFAAYWRQIVTTLRSIPGQHFRFDWNGGGGSNWDVTQAYPGDAYVDNVTADVYDQTWDPAAGYGNNTATSAGYARAWSDWTANLNWMASFASQHGKWIGFPEWGVLSRTDGHGGGDDPYFIQQMYNFMTTHKVAYETYSDQNTGEGDSVINDGRFPQSAAMFRQLFGST